MPNESEPAATRDSPASGRARGPRDILAAGLVTALLFASFLALPIVGALALPLLPVPAVRLTFRRGAAAGFSVVLLSCGLLLGLGLATGSTASALGVVLFAVVVTALPVLCAAAVGRGVEPSRAFLALCAAGFLLLAAGMGLRALTGGRTMRQEVAAAFDEMLPSAVESYTKGGMDAEAVARLKATLGTARDFSAKYWVGLLGVSWILSSAIGFYTGARAARPEPPAERARFDGLSVPPAVVLLFVAAGGAAVLSPDPARQIAANALLPLSALYFLAGLSIICHFARKWFRAKILRVGLYGLALYFPINIGVGLLGLFDWYADFRHRGEKA